MSKRGFGGVAIADIDVHALVAELERAGETQVAVGANGLDVGGEQALDEIEAARFQAGQADRGIDDRQIDDSVDENILRVPVAGIFFDDDAVLRDPLDEFVRAGAYRMQSEFVAFGLGRFRRNHHSGAVGQLRNQRREWRFQNELDREGIDNLDMVDRGKLRLAERAGHGHVPLERIFRGLGVEFLAVLERHVRPQLDGDGFSVRAKSHSRARAAAPR